MKMKTVFALTLGLAFFGLVIANDELGGANFGASDRALYDPLEYLDVTAVTGSDICLGVEYVQGSMWVTAAGMITESEPNYLFQINSNGVLVATYGQTTTSTWGWRDLATDQVYLYGSDSTVIEQISRNSGQPTGVTIPLTNTGLSLARGIAYDPVTDHFWVTGDVPGVINDGYEITRGGTVVSTFTKDTHWNYGLALDRVTPGGPYIWMANQDHVATQVNFDRYHVGTAAYDLAFDGPVGYASGGCTVTSGYIPGQLTFMVMMQDASDDPPTTPDEDLVASFDLAQVGPMDVPALKAPALVLVALLFAGLGVFLIRRHRKGLSA